MTNPDLQLDQQIDEMRARLIENARNEQTLLRALAEALGQVDQQLLAQVREVTAAHEARRGDILGELQVLASRLCVFPRTLAAERLRSDHQVTALNERPRAAPRHAPGDWRQAASNIDEELGLYLDSHGQDGRVQAN